MYFLVIFGICPSFFGAFIRAILERVYQSCNIYNASPFLFCSFESTYLHTSNLPTNLFIRGYLSKFSKSSFINRNSTIYQPKQYHLSNLFIVKFRFKQRPSANLLASVEMYCHQKLLS